VGLIEMLSGKTLCIDVGGTRIKAAVLGPNPCLKELTEAKTAAIRTLGWLNETLPHIIDLDNWAAVVNHRNLSRDYDRIAICVPGPVSSGIFLRPDLSVPSDLLLKLKSLTELPVNLCKDADAWAAGTVAFSELTGPSPSLPAICLAFGTGVGFSIVASSQEIISVEISKWQYGFSKLKEASHREINEAWQVHEVLGIPFFEWVAKSKKHWSYTRIRDEFTSRVKALIDDLLPATENRIGPIKTVFIGGGNAEFVSRRTLQSDMRMELRSVWNRNSQVNADLIPLLGLLKVDTEQKSFVRISPF